MAEEKKKNPQTALLIAGAAVLGVFGYYYYSSKKTSTQNESDSKQEQITYTHYTDDDTIDTFQSNKIDDSKLYESKSEDDPDDAPIITGSDEVQVPIIDDNKQEEEPQQNNNKPPETEIEPEIETVTTVNEIIKFEKPSAKEEEKEEEKEEKEEENANSPKEESSVMEDSPVIVNRVDPDSEPIVVKQMSDTQELEEQEDKSNKSNKSNKSDENEVEITESKTNESELAIKTLQYKNGKLTVTLINMVNIDQNEQEDKNKVLVRLNLSDQKEQISSIKENDGDGDGYVEFNEGFTLDVNDTLSDVLIVSVENNEKEIGKVEINVIDIVGSEGQCVKNRGFQVVGSKSECMVYLDLMYFEVNVVNMDKTES